MDLKFYAPYFLTRMPVDAPDANRTADVNLQEKR